MINNIVKRIEKLEPNPTEAIVIGFNFNDIKMPIKEIMFAITDEDGFPIT